MDLKDCLYYFAHTNRMKPQYQILPIIPLIWVQQVIRRIIKWAFELMYLIELVINKINGNDKYANSDVIFTIDIRCLIKMIGLKNFFYQVNSYQILYELVHFKFNKNINLLKKENCTMYI